MCDNCEMILVKSGRLRDHIDELHGHSKSTDETQKLGSETRLHQNYITVKSSLKSQATADPHCFQAVRWGKDRGDQGVKTLSGDNSHTPLIVGPNLGVDVVGERLSTKDPNGGIGEKERL